MKTEKAADVRLSGWEIPVHQYGLFRVILKSSGGDLDYAYTMHGVTHVGFNFDEEDDYAKWCRRWDLATTNIVERRKDARWRCVARRINRMLVMAVWAVANLIRFCLALVFAAAGVACFLLALLAVLAALYDSESLRPIVSWMPGKWSELPPEAYVLIYAFIPSVAAWLIQMLVGGHER